MKELDQEAVLRAVAADPRLGAVYDYWCSLAAAGEVPEFSRFDPICLPPLALPYVTLLDVIDGGSSFRVRLVGTGTTTVVGRNVTGFDLAKMASGDILEAALARYRAVVGHRRPIMDIVDYTMPHHPSLQTRLLTLPFSTTEPVIDRLLGIYSPSSVPMAQRILRNLIIPSDVRTARSRTVIGRA